MNMDVTGGSSEVSAVENYTASNIRDYLRRLGRRAAKRINRPALWAMRASVEDNARLGFDDVPRLRHLLNTPLTGVRALLLDQSAHGDAARALLPLEHVVPRAKRENIMRAVAGPLSAHGHTMAERWATNTAPRGLADAVVERTFSALEPLRGNFTRFVGSVPSFDWMITADFVIDGAGRPNDVFAYTVYPLSDPERTINEAQAALPRDYKHSRRGLDDRGLRYLASRKIFTFVFVPERGRRLIADVEEARKGIDYSIEMLRSARDAERLEPQIAQWKALRQRANANSFDFRLLENMMLSSNFAGAVATLLAGEGRADRVMWVPDRDDMTTAYGEILWQLFSENAWAFSLRRRLPPVRIMYGTEDKSHPGGTPWFDPVIRVPDFIAGVISGWDFATARTITTVERDKPILHEVICDNPNIALITFPKLVLGDIQSNLLRVSRRPQGSPTSPVALTAQ